MTGRKYREYEFGRIEAHLYDLLDGKVHPASFAAMVNAIGDQAVKQHEREQAALAKVGGQIEAEQAKRRTEWELRCELDDADAAIADARALVAKNRAERAAAEKFTPPPPMAQLRL